MSISSSNPFGLGIGSADSSNPFQLGVARPDQNNPFQLGVGRPGFSTPKGTQTSLYGQTVGAFQFGAADIGQNVFGYVGSKLWKDNFATDIARDLAQFKVNHPDYAPEEVDSAWDLLTNPRALVGRIFVGVPTAALILGSLAIPGSTGYLIAGGLGYAMESNRGYEQAMADGATEAEANTAAGVKGVIGAALNIVPFHLLNAGGRAGVGAIKTEAQRLAMGTLERLGLNKAGMTGITKFIATQSVFGAAMPVMDEGLSNQIYGKPISPGLLDRALQGAVGNTVMMSVFGYTARKLRELGGRGEVAPKPGEDLTNLGPSQAQQLYSYASNHPASSNIEGLVSYVSMKEAMVDPKTPTNWRATRESLNGAWKVLSSMWGGVKEGYVKDWLNTNLNNAHLWQEQFAGPFEGNVLKVYQKIGEGGINDLGKIQWRGDVGYSKFTQLNEAKVPGFVPDAWMSEPLSAVWQGFRVYAGNAAGDAGVVRMVNGALEITRPAETPRAPRVFDEGYQNGLIKGKPDAIEATQILQSMGEIKGMYPTFEGLRDYMLGEFNRAENPRYGHLQDVRVFPVMPDVVRLSSGKEYRITDPNIIDNLRYAAHKTGQTIASKVLFGQEGIENVGVKQGAKLLKTLGGNPQFTHVEMLDQLVQKGFSRNQLPDVPWVEGPPSVQKDVWGNVTGWKQPKVVAPLSDAEVWLMSAQFGVDIQRIRYAESKGPQAVRLLRRAYEKRGLNEGFLQKVEDRLTPTEKQKIVTLYELAGGSRKLSAEEVFAKLDWADPLGFTGEQVKAVKNWAKEVGGITLTNRDIPEVWRDVKERVRTTVVEDGMKKLKSDYLNEDGNVKDVEDILQLWQIHSIHPYGRGPIRDVGKAVHTTLAMMMTSLSAVPQLAQNFFVGPKYVGMGKLLRGLVDITKNYRLEQSDGVMIGSFQPALLTRSKSGGLLSVMENVSGYGRRALGITAANERNSVWLAAAGKSLMKFWEKTGIHGSDEVKARNLRFSPAEIAQVNTTAAAGEPMSPFLYRKGIQVLVAKGAYGPEASFNKSLIQNFPALKMVFAFSSYAEGVGRNVLDLSRDATNIFTSGKPVSRMVSTVKDLALVLAGGVGVGLVTQMLRQAIKGNLGAWKDKDLMERGKRALAEVAILGSSQRMMDAFTYDQGMIEKFWIGMMPTVSLASSYIGGLLGYGQYGKFALDERLWETTKRGTPLVRGITQWINNAAYPSVTEYRQVRQASKDFGEDVLKRVAPEQTGINQLDPQYYHIYQAITRGENDEAQALTQSYYQTKQAEGVSLQKAALSLRSSLEGRSPIPFTDLDTIRFLRSLPEKQRKQAVSVYMGYQRQVDLLAPGGWGGRGIGQVRPPQRPSVRR